MSVFDILNPANFTKASELLLEAVDQYVVRPTGEPNSTIGISGFIFNIKDDEAVNLRADITDHYVEDNYAIHDHIALKPETITLKGFVGELTDAGAHYLSIAVAVLDRLPKLLDFSPEFTDQAEQVYGAISSVTGAASSVIEQATSLYNLFSLKSTTANKQQNAFNYFYSMWLTRQLCTVETPYNVFYNMAIEDVRAVQRGESRYISDFHVTFKKIRTTSIIGLSRASSAVDDAIGRLAQDLWKTAENGQTQGTKTSVDELVKAYVPETISDGVRLL